MGWGWHRQDRAAVLDALKRGERPYAAMAAGLTELDELGYLAWSLGVFDALRVLMIKREREGIPDHLLLGSLVVLPFIQAFSLTGAAEALFRSPAILLRIGYSALNLREGFNQRYHNPTGSKQALPMHVDDLRDELARIDAESLREFEAQCVAEVFKRGLVRGNVYAVDATGLHDDWKLVVLSNVTRARAFLVSWRLLPGKVSEKGAGAKVTLALVDEALRRGAVGKRAGIGRLVMDAEYADGPLLARLKWGRGPEGQLRGIESLVRLPEDRNAYADMQGLARLKEGMGAAQREVEWEKRREVRYVNGHKEDRKVECAAFSGLQSWDAFVEEGGRLGAPEGEIKLWGALVREVEPESRPVEEAMGLIGTESFPSAWEGYMAYRERWEIENGAFRELKEGWHLEEAPWGRSEEVVRGRVAFTLVGFNVAQAYKAQAGQHLLNLGIRRLELQVRRTYGLAPVVVYTQDCYAVFELEELLAIFGHPVMESLLPVAKGRKIPVRRLVGHEERGPPWGGVDLVG